MNAFHLTRTLSLSLSYTLHHERRFFFGFIRQCVHTTQVHEVKNMDMTWVVLCYAAMQEALHALTNDASLHNLTHPWYFVANSIGIAYFIRVGRVL